MLFAIARNPDLNSDRKTGVRIKNQLIKEARATSKTNLKMLANTWFGSWAVKKERGAIKTVIAIETKPGRMIGWRLLRIRPHALRDNMQVTAKWATREADRRPPMPK
jgi:hypothetical protein